MFLFDVDFLPVVIAAFIHYLFGWLWYTKLFGRSWLEGMGYRQTDCQCEWYHYLGGFAVSFLTAWVFAGLLDRFYIRDIEAGGWFGFYVWLGFGLTKFFSGYLWTKENFNVFLINASYSLIGLVFFGLFLTWW